MTEIHVPSLVHEFRNATLHDRRQSKRLRRIATAFQLVPGKSIPDTFQDDSQTEAYYRFTNNDAVDAADLFAAHNDQTVERCLEHQVVLAIHDSSELGFSSYRTGCYELRPGEYGFIAHFTLAVTADDRRRPLGVLGYRRVKRDPKESGETETVSGHAATPEAEPGTSATAAGSEPGTDTASATDSENATAAETKTKNKTKKRHWRDVFNDPNKESQRWVAGALEAAEYVPRKTKLIHVMDREADSFENLERLDQAGQSYVIRMNHDRRVADEEVTKVSGLTARAPIMLERQVKVSKRPKNDKPRAAAKHPEREERIAHLVVTACEASILRPSHMGAGEPLPVHIVEVREVDAPENEPPVEWRLITDLPISTPEEVAAIVDHYRARWLIEEYFKALKTGCGFLKLQQTSLSALERALAIFAPQAWRLLLLRWVDHHEPGAPPTAVVSDTQLETLKTLHPKVPLKTARDVTRLIARMGGHLKSNGRPGWLVLGRGLERLLQMELIYTAMAATHRKSAPKPRKSHGGGSPKM